MTPSANGNYIDPGKQYLLKPMRVGREAHFLSVLPTTWSSLLGTASDKYSQRGAMFPVCYLPGRQVSFID